MSIENVILDNNVIFAYSHWHIRSAVPHAENIKQGKKIMSIIIIPIFIYKFKEILGIFFATLCVMRPDTTTRHVHVGTRVGMG